MSESPPDLVQLGTVRTIVELRERLQAALTVEWATIPVYLSGWWSIHDPLTYAATVLQSIMIAEMRHLAVAANILIATGGIPSVTRAARDFVYPTRLPHGVTALEVRLLPFGRDFLGQALAIERPTTLAEVSRIDRDRFLHGEIGFLPGSILAMGHIYQTIGEFYEAIIAGILTLVAKFGEEAVFPASGNPLMQIGYFGTQNITVRSSAEAIILLRNIMGEGEGTRGTRWDENNQLSHYYRLRELLAGRSYTPGDSTDNPTGPEIPTPTGDQVANVHSTPKMSSYAPGSDMWKAADAFNRLYARIITNLDVGFSGNPAQISAAFGQMIQLQAAGRRVLVYPFPGRLDEVAGPTFELTPYDL